MNDDEARATISWIDSIDFSTADEATCLEARRVLGELQDRFDEAIGELIVRLKPPLCSVHCRFPQREMAA